MALSIHRKILLFGGTGFVGSAICEAFNNLYTVIAPTHKELDITDFFSLKKNIEFVKPDFIIYSSGLANIDSCEENPELAFLLNAKVPEVIAAEAVNFNIPIYYLSSDAVFKGDQTDAPYKEEDIVNPFSVYGKTKQKGEEAILKISNNNAVVRIICPFSSYYPKKTDFIRLAVENLSKNKQFVGITDQVTNPLYMPYLTNALHKLVDSRVSGIYHLGATDSDTNYNIVKRLAAIFNFNPALIVPITLEVFQKNKKALRSQFGWLDVSKFEKEFGKGIVNNLETSLQDFFKDIE